MARAEAATREQLIEAAARILAADGLGGLSTRRLAHELGVSTMVVYTRFGSMPELIGAVVAEGFDRQASRLAGVTTSADPLADLVALGVAYRANAVDNPHLYSIMYGGSEEPQRRNVQAKETLDRFQVAAARAVESGALRADPTALASALWSAAHGFVSLELSGVLPAARSGEEALRELLLTLLS